MIWERTFRFALVVAVGLATILLCTSCTGNVQKQAVSDNTSEVSAPLVVTDEVSSEVSEVIKEDMEVDISIGEYSFKAVLEQNEAVKEFMELLPMTVEMGDLNSNEKFVYLDKPLTADRITPKTINAGDIMLYGTDCLVIFYESFNSSYSYTKLGEITNVENLARALGKSNVIVTFS